MQGELLTPGGILKGQSNKDSSNNYGKTVKVNLGDTVGIWILYARSWIALHEGNAVYIISNIHGYHSITPLTDLNSYSPKVSVADYILTIDFYNVDGGIYNLTRVN